MLAIGHALGSTVVLPRLDGPDPASRVGGEIVYAGLIQAIGDRGFDVVDSEELIQLVGRRATWCATRSTCPQDIWTSVDGDLAAKGSVVMSGDTITAALEFHLRGQEGPADHFQATFGADEANRFAVDAALIIDDLLKRGPAPSAVVLPPTASKAIQEDALGPVVPQDEPPVQREMKGQRGESESAAANMRSRRDQEQDERRYMGLPAFLYREYEASGLTREEFLDQKRFRGKRFLLEAAPGVVFGDIQRRYTAIARVIGETATTYYERDQMLTGTAFGLALGMGYAPSWWLELGLHLGIEFPKKDFVSGYEQYRSLGDFQAGHRCPDHCDITSFRPALAVALLLEPRVRLHFRPAGLVKPYTLLGWSARVHDGYDTPDYVQVSYPNRSGIQSWGPMGGLGIGFDTHAKGGMFVESTYTYLLGPGIYQANPGAVYFPPKAQTGLNMVMTVKAGFAVRY